MAGSKPGERRGGRQKGTPNKTTAKRAAEIAASGLTPLDFMLAVLRAEDSTPEDKKWAAQQAAPFCHPRLTSVDARVLAEINARVEQAHVLDSRTLDPEKRALLRALLEEAASAAFERGQHEERT